MTRDELEHAIRAACDLTAETELWIFGSQAILAQHPDAPPALRQSLEVDVSPKNRPEVAGLIDGALGELSRFHVIHGFYVHGLSIEAAILPAGWQDRTVLIQTPATRGNKGHCLEAHDLAASKLVAFREKDRDYVRTLLVEMLVSPELLLDRIAALPIEAELATRLTRWVEATVRDLSA
jgi:hypothetical protein